MYRHCIYFSAELGEAEALKGIPGRRFAFDAELPRAWVICLRCARWSLFPAALRSGAWEALRYAFEDGAHVLESENVELRRCGDASVIRLGSACDEERAVWRYAGAGGFRPFWGEELRLFALLAGLCAIPVLLGAPLLTGGVLAYAGPVAGVGVGFAWHRQIRREKAAIMKVAAERSPTRAEIVLGTGQVARSRLLGENGAVCVLLPEAVPHSEPLRLAGDDMRLLLMQLVPGRNPVSSREADLHRALELARESGHSEAQLERSAARSPLLGFGSASEPDAGNTLDRDELIAIEIMLHREMEADTEPAAAMLERAWLHAAGA